MNPYVRGSRVRSWLEGWFPGGEGRGCSASCALTLAFLLSWVSLESVEGLGLEPRNPVSQVGAPVSPLCLAGHVGVWWAGEVWGKGAQEESRGLPILRCRDGPCRML